MRIVFSVGSMKNTSLEEQIIFAKEAGFDGIDYLQQIRDIFFTPKEILRLSEKHAMKIRVVHIPLPFVLFAPVFLHKRILKSLQHFPHIELFNIHLSTLYNPLQRNIQHIENFFTLAKKQHIRVSVESNSNEYLIPDYLPKVTYDPDTFATFCRQHALPITVDTSHIASWKTNIVDFFKQNHQFINLFHLSDLKHKNHHLPFGKGDLPLKKLFEEMKKVHFKGTIVFEIFNFPKNLSESEILAEIKDSLHMFKKHAL